MRHCGKPIYLAIFRHSSAQRLQACAQSWQCWALCLAHSSPHALQISAHSLQMALAWALPRAIAAAASWQIAAQSISSAMHLVIAFTSSSARHEAAQWLQAVAHSLHASMHDSNLSCGITELLWLIAGKPAKGRFSRP
jgi:hypothetical protein